MTNTPGKTLSSEKQLRLVEEPTIVIDFDDEEKELVDLSMNDLLYDPLDNGNQGA
jgi:hypothetical protein